MFLHFFNLHTIYDKTSYFNDDFHCEHAGEDVVKVVEDLKQATQNIIRTKPNTNYNNPDIVRTQSYTWQTFIDPAKIAVCRQPRKTIYPGQGLNPRPPAWKSGALPTELPMRTVLPKVRYNTS